MNGVFLDVEFVRDFLFAYNHATTLTLYGGHDYSCAVDTRVRDIGPGCLSSAEQEKLVELVGSDPDYCDCPNLLI